MRLSDRETENWLAGQQPAGASYLAGEQVVVVRNGDAIRVGTVLLLTELDPEPRYLIQVGCGHYLQALQSTLMKAG